MFAIINHPLWVDRFKEIAFLRNREKDFTI